MYAYWFPTHSLSYLCHFDSLPTPGALSFCGPSRPPRGAERLDGGQGAPAAPSSRRELLGPLARRDLGQGLIHLHMLIITCDTGADKESNGPGGNNRKIS